jgi:NAD(P)-dependent dehydrogenase (short-subunit alcohol dehydrogenase family)
VNGASNGVPKIALITGAAGGLGLAVAKTLATRGYRIVGIDHDNSGAQRFMESASVQDSNRPVFLNADVTSHADVSRVVREAIEAAGPIDALVTCAGIREIEDVLSITPERWNEVIAINVSGTFFCCQEVAKAMVAAKHGGGIVTIASIAGFVGVPNRPAYTASKHAVIGLTKNLAVDLAPHGIRVNAVAPGTIRTPLTEAYWHNARFLEEMPMFVPLHDRGTPADVGNAVAFLLSEDSNFITGIALPVDGGFLSTKSYSTGGAGSPYVKTS